MRRKVAVGVVAALLAALLGVASRPAAAAAGDPFGSFDVLERVPGGLRIAGWAMDPNTPAATQVHVYVDGVAGYQLTANLYRPDVGSVYGNGDYHGLDGVIPYQSAGDHTVCAYAIEIAAPGSNQQIQCRTITIKNDPFGSLDLVSQRPGTVLLQGWAIDPDVAGSISVHAYVDGVGVAGTADAYRSDIAAVYPAWGGYHGYSIEVPFTTGGTHTVCAYGINTGAGGNAVVGGACQSFTVQTDPSGALVGAVTQQYTGLKISGWGVDPSTAAAVDVQVRRYTAASSYTSYTTVWTGTANQASPTVTSPWTAWGANWS